jgi:hypothetical protein
MSLFSSVFFHPTVMLRRSVLVDNNLAYQPGFESVEDYDFWVRLLEHTQGANLDQPLVRYRVHAESISSQYKQEQMIKHAQISFAYIRRTFPEIQITPDEHAMLVAAFTGNLSPLQNRKRPALARRYLQLWQAFVRRHRGNPALKRVTHTAVLLAGKIGLYPPFQSGWMETIHGLYAADPLWEFYFGLQFINMIYLKIQGTRLEHMRQGSL